MIGKFFTAITIILMIGLNFGWPKILGNLLMTRFNILGHPTDNPDLMIVSGTSYILIYSSSLIMIGLITGLFCGLFVTNKNQGAAYRKGLVAWLLLNVCFLNIGPTGMGEPLHIVEIFQVGITIDNIHLFSMFGFIAGFLYLVMRNFSASNIYGLGSHNQEIGEGPWGNISQDTNDVTLPKSKSEDERNKE